MQALSCFWIPGCVFDAPGMEERRRPGTARFLLRFQRMHYVIYFFVATPLLLGWLFWEAATMPPQAPLFASGYEHISPEPAQTLASAPVAAPAANKKLAKNEGSSAN
jgi:hypothetical protein